MAINNLSDCIPILNEQIAFLEELSEYHSKVDALLEVALSDNFFHKEPLLLHNFFWNISDIINKAKVLNTELLNALVLIVKNLSNESNTSSSGGTLH